MFDRSIFEIEGAGRAFALLALLSALQAGLTIGLAWALSKALCAFAYAAAPDSQMLMLGIFVLCFVGQRLCALAREEVLERYVPPRVAALRRRVLTRYFGVGALDSAGLGSASACAMVLEGMEQVDSYLRLIMAKMALLMVVPPMLLIALFVVDWVSALIALVAFPCIIMFMVLVGSTAAAQAQRRQADQHRLSNHFLDSMRGLETLRSFGRAREHAHSIFTMSERLRRSTVATLRVATLSGAVLDLFATFSLAAVAIMLGFRLVEGSMQLFPALMVLVLVPEYFKPVREFAADYHASLDGRCALEAARAVADAPLPEGPVLPAGTWNSHSVLELHGVEATYPAATSSALHKVDLTLSGYARVGIVGLSGSGKTTLINLLGGFMDASAGSLQVCWDAQNEGTQVTTLAIDSWRKQVVYVPQAPHVFYASILDNIRFYVPSASREAVQQAAHAVGLDLLLSQLPEGLDTLIGSGPHARTVSGGEAHRIALARALLDTSRRILLFDEPTAHLDIETEHELKQQILPLFKDRLVVMATHRLHWLDQMDYVVVVEHGNIVEQGKPAKLLAQNGSLSKLVKASKEVLPHE